MTNKKNKLNELFVIFMLIILLLLLGLVYFPKAPVKRTGILVPLFGHFYPEASTNVFSMPNLRCGSGIR